MKQADLNIAAANLMQSVIDKEAKIPPELEQFIETDEYGNRYLLFPELIAIAEEETPTEHPKPLPFLIDEARPGLYFDNLPKP